MKKVKLALFFLTVTLMATSSFAYDRNCLLNYGMALASHPNFDSDPLGSIIAVLEQPASDVGTVVRTYCATQPVSQRVCLTNFAMGVTAYPNFASDKVASIIKVLEQPNSPEGKVLRDSCP